MRLKTFRTTPPSFSCFVSGTLASTAQQEHATPEHHDGKLESTDTSVRIASSIRNAVNIAEDFMNEICCVQPAKPRRFAQDALESLGAASPSGTITPANIGRQKISSYSFSPPSVCEHLLQPTDTVHRTIPYFRLIASVPPKQPFTLTRLVHAGLIFGVRRPFWTNIFGCTSTHDILGLRTFAIDTHRTGCQV